MRVLVPLLFAALVWACAPPVLKGTGDLRLRAILDTRGATPEAIVPLLAPEVEVHRDGETLKGARAGAAALADVRPDGPTEVLRHHQVSLVLLGDGRTLLVERDTDDRITRAVLVREPTPADGLPRRFVFWGAAWNTNRDPARRDLVQASYAADGYYVDPGHEVRGVDEVNRMIGNLRLVAPGSVLHYTTGLAEMGGGWATESWVMLSRPGGRVLFRGVDVIRLNPEGKIDYLAGFIGTRSTR